MDGLALRKVNLTHIPTPTYNPKFGLPGELHDKIIDQLHEDRAMLRVCSLINHSWRRRAQLHLFHTISPRSQSSVDALIGILDRSPWIADAVRVVVLRLRLQFRPAIPTTGAEGTVTDGASRLSQTISTDLIHQLASDTTRIEHAFSLLGRRLSGVTSLILSHWSDFSRVQTSFTSLVSNLPCLIDLQFENIAFDNWNQLFSAIEARPGISRLSLKHTWFQMSSPTLTTEARLFLPHLERLELSPDYIIKVVCPALSQSLDGLQCFKTLDVNGVISPDGAQAVAQLLLAVSSHLENLSFGLSGANVGDTLSDMLETMQPKFNKLRRLALRYNLAESPDAIYRLVFGLKTLQLRDVTIHFYSRYLSGLLDDDVQKHWKRTLSVLLGGLAHASTIVFTVSDYRDSHYRREAELEGGGVLVAFRTILAEVSESICIDGLSVECFRYDEWVLRRKRWSSL